MNYLNIIPFLSKHGGIGDVMKNKYKEESF